MGKGTIVNHIGAGKYNVTLNIDDSRAQQIITELEDSISDLDGVILELQNKRALAWSLYNSARTVLNVIINQYVAGTATKEQVITATASMNAKYRLYTEYNKSVWDVVLRQKSFEKRKEYIETKLAENPEPTVEAWCADLTEDLSGIVGTVEIPNERTNDVQIRPGYDGEAVYNADRDGQLQHVVSSTAAGVYYNYAMFPGWQKWKPTYRVGTILSVNHSVHTANVLLDTATSSAQNLDVNVLNSLTDVPIVYMDCDSDVFEIGDRVVVEFISQDHTDPRIIGFETNPKECTLDLISIMSGSGSSSTNVHDGITGTINFSCIPLGYSERYDIWRGCTFTGTDFMAYNWTKKWLVVFDGVGTNICSPKLIFPMTSYFWRMCIAYNGTYLITVSAQYPNVIDVFNISLTPPYSISLAFSYTLPQASYTVYGLCWDWLTGDLITGGRDDVQTYSGRIRKYEGLTNVLKEEIIYPNVPRGIGWGPHACDGLTMKGSNLITWGGRSAETPSQDLAIRLHDGFSANILQTYPYVPVQFAEIDCIVYPKNG